MSGGEVGGVETRRREGEYHPTSFTDMDTHIFVLHICSFFVRSVWNTDLYSAVLYN